MIPSGMDAEIADESYPLTTAELLERYGDRELEVGAGAEPIEDVFERMADEVYESADDVRLAVFTGVSHEAVGRRHYSDRDPTPPGAPFGHEQVSF